MLPASVLYGGQEGLKPLSFKMCAFQGEKPLTNRLLQFIDKTADMESVADGMVSLNGQRKQAAVLIGIIFPHGKNREQIIVTVLQVQIEPVKGDPGNHGDRKGIRRRAGLWLHSMDVAILFQVLSVGLQKVSEPGMILRPEG